MSNGRGVQLTFFATCAILMLLLVSVNGIPIGGEPSSQGWTWEVELTFPKVTLNTDGDTEIRMGDLPLVGGEGEPLLPVRSVMVPIPDDYEVTGVDVQFHSVESMGPIGSPALSMELPISEPVSSYGDALNTPQVAYPLERVRLEGVHTLDGERFAIVNIFPVSLDISSGTVLTAGSGTLTVAAAATGSGISEATEVVTGDGQAQTSDVIRFTGEILRTILEPAMIPRPRSGISSSTITTITTPATSFSEAMWR